MLSNADVGSSNNNKGFFNSIVVAKSILCFSPPEISLILEFSRFLFSPNKLKKLIISSKLGVFDLFILNSKGEYISSLTVEYGKEISWGRYELMFLFILNGEEDEHRVSDAGHGFLR